MKKKLFTGFSLMAVAGMAFWACGDGNINKIDENDNLNAMMYPDSAGWDKFLVEQKTACKSNPSCMEMYGAYVQGNEVPVSSAEAIVSSSSIEKDPNADKFLSSSRQELDIDGGEMPSSSSMNIIDDDPVSSSSEALVVTGLGSCKPTNSPIDKGTPTTWTFVPNPAKTADSKAYGAMAFAQATYAWNFGDGLSEEAPGISTASGKVIYPNSGKYGASVTVSVMNKETKLTETETIECSQLQVNGEKITGCKCTPSVDGAAVTGSVNMKEHPDVVWTVTGCTSAAEINSWEWDGTAGTESFTKNFTAETASYAPTLKVGNNDNTVQDVTCDAVKVTDGAEFTIKGNQTEADKAKFPAAGKYNVVIAYACQNKQFYCNGDGAEVGVTVNGNGSLTAKGWYVTVNLGDGDCSGSASVSVAIKIDVRA